MSMPDPRPYSSSCDVSAYWSSDVVNTSTIKNERDNNISLGSSNNDVTKTSNRFNLDIETL